jgi:hypothetical protein
MPLQWSLPYWKELKLDSSYPPSVLQWSVPYWIELKLVLLLSLQTKQPAPKAVQRAYLWMLQHAYFETNIFFFLKKN